MLRNGWLLFALYFAVPLMALAREKQPDSYPPSGIDIHPDCTTVPGNLVQNYGFESGSFSAWVQSGDTTFTSVTGATAHSGSFGAAFGPFALGFIAQILINTVPGQTYTISFWLRNVGQPSEFQLFWDGILISDWMSAGTFVYTQFSYAGNVASSSLTELKFGFSNTPDFFFIDDIVVEAF